MTTEAKKQDLIADANRDLAEAFLRLFESLRTGQQIKLNTDAGLDGGLQGFVHRGIVLIVCRPTAQSAYDGGYYGMDNACYLSKHQIAKAGFSVTG